MRKLPIIFLLGLLTLAAVAAYPNPGHPASSIGPGTFSAGNYTFPAELDVTGNLVINTSMFFVNASSGKVGIATLKPTQALDVNGSVNVSGASAILYTPQICLNGVCQTTWPSGTITGTGIANYTARWTNSTNLGAGALYDNGSVVGIGNTAPNATLHVTGTGNFTSTLFVGSTITGASGLTIQSGTVSLPSGSVQNVALGNSSLTVSAGNGLNTTGSSISLGGSATIAINATTCSAGQYSYWNGTAWLCATDNSGSGGNITSTNGTAGNVALFTNSTNIVAWTSSNNILNASGINAANLTSGTVPDARISSTFNNQSIGISTNGSVTTTITSSPLTASGTINIQFSCANSSQNGTLCNADWSTFNGKAATGTSSVCTYGIANYTLSASGIAVTCASQQGTVTSVATGNGLTGGTFTTSGTISVNATVSGVGNYSYWNGSAWLTRADLNNVYTAGNGLNLSGSSVFAINATTCSAGQYSTWNGTAFTCATDNTGSGGNITGNGATNYSARWTNGTNLGAGALYDNGSVIGIGNTAPNATLHVVGTENVSSTLFVGSTITGASGLTIQSGTVSLPSGSVQNVALGNSSLTVTAGTGLSGGGSITLGGSTTINTNATTSGAGNYSYWNGSAWLTRADLNNAYTAGNGLNLSGSSVFAINATTCSAGQYSTWNGTAWNCAVDNSGSGGNITGNGAANYTARFSNGTYVVTGSIYDNGSVVGIGNTAPNSTLHVVGTGNFTSTLFAGSTITGASGLTIQSGSVSLPSGSISNVELANSSVTVSNGTGLSGGGSVALGGSTTLSLANTAVVVGSYGNASAVGNFTVDAQGRITGASTTAIALNAAAITSGALGVARGGTGAATFPSNGVLLGNAATNVTATVAGAADTVLRVPTAGGAPAFGAINLSSGSAVTNKLGVANGGTGLAASVEDAVLVGSGTSTWQAQTLPSCSGTTSKLLYDNSSNTFSCGTGTYQTTVSQEVDTPGWYKVANITGINGRGQLAVTIFVTGGTLTPRSTTIRMWKDWSTTAGLTILSEYGNGYWNESRVTNDTSNSYLEVYFTQAVNNSATMQLDGGQINGGTAGLYSGVLSAGSGQVLANATMGLLNIGSNKFFIDSTGKVGIGTALPSSTLSIVGTANISSTLYLDSNKCPSGQYLTSDPTTGAVSCSTPAGTATGNITGNGSANYIGKWANGTYIATGLLYDNGSGIGIGSTAPTQALHVVGSANITQNIYYGGNLTGYGADFAEQFSVGEPLHAGDVVCLGDTDLILRCAMHADKAVVGVVSSQPTIIGNGAAKDAVPVGVVGIVPTQVRAPVSRFDMLTTSGMPGYAERAGANDSGALIGKAMESCTSGVCTIKVLVTLG